MHSVSAEKRIKFLNFQFLGFELLVARRGVTRRRLAFLARLRAFDCNDFAGHKKLFFVFCRLLFGFLFFFDFGTAGIINGAQGAQPSLA